MQQNFEKREQVLYFVHSGEALLQVSTDLISIGSHQTILKKKLSNIYFTNLQILFALFTWESQGPRSQLLLLIRPQIVLFSNVCFACLYAKLHIRCDVFVLEFYFKETFIQAIKFADYAPFQSFYYSRFLGVQCAVLDILRRKKKHRRTIRIAFK